VSALPLLLGVLAAQGALDVTAGVDRARIARGEELTLTVRARSRSAAAVEIVLPRLVGFTVTGSREASEVTLAGPSPARVTTRELTLRGEQAGRLVIGAVVARQGAVEVRTAPIEIVVDTGAAAPPGGLGPVARALLDAMPPPRGGDAVSVAVIVSADTVLAGEQVDVVAVAWFPRAVRDRLRRPPVVTLPAAAGAWVLPQPAPSGVAASHRGADGWYDAFAVHHVLLPLAAGRVVIPPASVSYALPLSYAFFSREERLTLTADSVAIAVSPLPAGGDGGSVVASDLALAVAVAPDARVGEPVDVTVTLSGTGNVPLWPEPQLAWPPGFRAYPTGSTARYDAADGHVSGGKTFRAVVVPDTAGSFVLPDLRYPYYDPPAGAWRAAVAPPRSLIVAAEGEPRAARATPPLAAGVQVGAADRLTGLLEPEAWLLAAALPPALALLARRRRRAPTPVAPPPAAPRTRLGRLEREFDALLASHVPLDQVRFGSGLAQALRAAGVEGAVADHVVRLRDRLRAARYGPEGVGDEPQLAVELEQVIAALGGTPGRRRRRTAAVALLVGCVVCRSASAQSLSAEALYEAGALRAAADSFAARAAAAPRVAAHRYNLGAAWYRAGADGRAAAAWTRAARLAPRDPVVRRARALLPAPDAASEPLLGAGPFTLGEWLLVGGAAWVLVWGSIAARRRRTAAVVAVIAAVAAAGAGREWWRDRRPVAVVQRAGTAVRTAPHGAAATATTLDAGAAALMERHYGAWIEIRRADGVRGWVRDDDLVTP
jgi:hypothetical protein